MYRLLLLGIGEEFKPLEFLWSQFENTIVVHICPMKQYRLTDSFHISSLEMIDPSAIDQCFHGWLDIPYLPAISGMV